MSDLWPLCEDPQDERALYHQAATLSNMARSCAVDPVPRPDPVKAPLGDAAAALGMRGQRRRRGGPGLITQAAFSQDSVPGASSPWARLMRSETGSSQKEDAAYDFAR